VSALETAAAAIVVSGMLRLTVCLRHGGTGCRNGVRLHLLLCSSCGLRIKNALVWTFAMAIVLGLAIGCAYGECSDRGSMSTSSAGSNMNGRPALAAAVGDSSTAAVAAAPERTRSPSMQLKEEDD
jgi:hypothetical protein